MSLPVGLVCDLSGRVVQHPDQEVRDRIAFVFARFLRVKAIYGVVREMVAARLLLPRRESGRDDGAIVWRQTDGGGDLESAAQPAYAGTFVYGRTLSATPARWPVPQAPSTSGAMAVHGSR